jgi:cardiolipin synthase
MSVSSLGTLLLVVDILVIAILIPRIIIQRRESAATLAWVLFILIAPLVGAVFFYLVGTRRMHRRRRRRAIARERLAPSAARIETMMRAFAMPPAQHDESEWLEGARAALSVDRSTTTDGNDIEVYHHGPAAFDAMESAIRSARRHVHVEFYIFDPDRAGTRLIECLIERARAGVEVRLLRDAMGSRDLRASHLKPLLEAGAQVAEFLPINPLARPFSVNFRNHRKIVVIDGTTAFTGGMNVADEYRDDQHPKLGRWRDTMLRLRGPAVLRYQEIFAEDWSFTTGELCVGTTYFPAPQPQGTSLVQVIDSGPDGTALAIHRALFVAISSARQRVWITTPYFVPDRAILVAMQTAAMRGVDVRLLLPAHGDQYLVFHASRSHYDELLDAGVRVYEYTPGFVHAKTMLVDAAWCTIGSANMDHRSFMLNWEANLFALDPTLTRHMATQFLEDLDVSLEIKRPVVRSLKRRFEEAGSYLVSPLL